MILLAGQSNMQALHRGRYFAGKRPICVAVGGTSITQWLPGEVWRLFEKMAEYAPKADALVFWQGETDAIHGHDGAERWDVHFGAMVRALRDVKPGLPVIFGETPQIDGQIHLHTVRERQAVVAAEGLGTLVPCPTYLPLADPHHLAPESLAFMAERFRQALAEALG